MNKILAVLLVMVFTVQCENLIDDSLLDNPNALQESQVDADFLLNNIQLSFRGVYSGAAGTTGALVRYTRLFGESYDVAIIPQTFDGFYQSAYAGLMIDVENLLPIAEANNLFFHMGIAQTLKAYTMLTIVDLFGDMPYSEALDANNFNPALDDDEAIYAAALSLLDVAITNFNKASLKRPSDFYFPNKTGENQRIAWVKTANTIKLKALLNMKHVDTNVATKINAISDSLIWDQGDAFTFQYSTNTTNPDSRHPSFTNNYINGGSTYMGMSIMHIMTALSGRKQVRDPRVRFYFYRQTTSNSVDPNERQCMNANRPSHYGDNEPWCQLEDGYWGDDHLNSSGIPPDAMLRTIYGVYPAGGQFDANQNTRGRETSGLEGAGIRPILMPAFSMFMMAEAIATIPGVNGKDAKEILEDAVNASITTVQNFGASISDPDLIPDPASYIAEVKTNYDDDAMRTIAVEYYVAAWPNGLEAYNLMRRTGYPSRADGIQPATVPNPGKFYRSVVYPASMVNRNDNANHKDDNHARVFWDTRGTDNEFDY